jgi:iron complex transport system substrate-binding protein
MLAGVWTLSSPAVGSQKEAASAALAQGGAISITDDRSVTLVAKHPILRIVTLAPHLSELAFAAGASGKLVGVSSFSDYPAAALLLPTIGDASAVDLERIVSLRPDLVLGWRSGNRPGDIAKLEQMGIPVFVTEPTAPGDIPRLLRAIGMLAATMPNAERAAAQFEAQWQALRSRFAKARPVSVFIEIWHDPLTTVSGRHLISALIDSCGGRNVFSGAASLAPTIDVESLFGTDPEAVIGAGSASDATALAMAWSQYPALRAVQGGRLYWVDADLIQRHTPRILQGLAQICAALDEVRSAPSH